MRSKVTKWYTNFSLLCPTVITFPACTQCCQFSVLPSWPFSVHFQTSTCIESDHLYGIEDRWNVYLKKITHIIWQLAFCCKKSFHEWYHQVYDIQSNRYLITNINQLQLTKIKKWIPCSHQTHLKWSLATCGSGYSSGQHKLQISTVQELVLDSAHLSKLN
jgi:hypothetical protein